MWCFLISFLRHYFPFKRLLCGSSRKHSIYITRCWSRVNSADLRPTQGYKTTAIPHMVVNSLAPGRCGSNSKHIVCFSNSLYTIVTWVFAVKLLSGECCRTSLMWKSALVQVMAWCRQATSHYLGQCWFRSVLPYDITRPQWINSCTSE